MPVLAALHEAFEAAWTCTLSARPPTATRRSIGVRPPFALLDDSSLKVSFASDIDTVPTLFWAGRRRAATETAATGFVRDEWQKLAPAPCEATGRGPPRLGGACPSGGRGVGRSRWIPLIARRLRAESENSPLRARRIEIGRAGRRGRVPCSTRASPTACPGATDAGTGHAHAGRHAARRPGSARGSCRPTWAR